MLRSKRHYLLLTVFLLCSRTLASSGDRNPTFQHCLRECQLKHCDSSTRLPLHLRAFGWDCMADCKYGCTHVFTDNIGVGGKWHQFYGKWPFYRLGPIQEPCSVLMSLGNLYVNLQGLTEVRRRVRGENRLRRWLEVLGWVQVDTWVWSAVFHTRDTPLTERLDYFAATLTISSTLLYTLLRILSLQTPLSTSKLVLPVSTLIGILILGHFTYLLSFPVGSFPYGYHTMFNLVLGIAHNLLWILWSSTFFVRIPSLKVGRYTLGLPYPYPPNNPRTTPRPKDATTPLVLVLFTTAAMSLELFDFAPWFRTIDAHSLWHAATIPLAVAWWRFLCDDAVEMERVMLGGDLGADGGVNEKMPLTGGGGRKMGTGLGWDASTGLGVGDARRRSRSRSPGRGLNGTEKGVRVD